MPHFSSLGVTVRPCIPDRQTDTYLYKLAKTNQILACYFEKISHKKAPPYSNILDTVLALKSTFVTIEHWSPQRHGRDRHPWPYIGPHRINKSRQSNWLFSRPFFKRVIFIFTTSLVELKSHELGHKKSPSETEYCPPATVGDIWACLNYIKYKYKSSNILTIQNMSNAQNHRYPDLQFLKFLDSKYPPSSVTRPLASTADAVRHGLV